MAITGPLALTDGCLMVSGVPVVLPDTAVWNSEDQVVEVGELAFAIGDDVSWAGSAGPVDAAFDLPETCPDLGEISIVYEMSHLP